MVWLLLEATGVDGVHWARKYPKPQGLPLWRSSTDIAWNAKKLLFFDGSLQFDIIFAEVIAYNAEDWFPTSHAEGVGTAKGIPSLKVWESPGLPRPQSTIKNNDSPHKLTDLEGTPFYGPVGRSPDQANLQPGRSGRNALVTFWRTWSRWNHQVGPSPVPAEFCQVQQFLARFAPSLKPVCI